MNTKTKIGLIIAGVALVVAGFLFGASNIKEEAPAPRMGGNLTATPGIQNGNGPVTTLDNVDVYNLDVSNAFAVDGATTLTGALTAETVDVSNFTYGGGRLNAGISGLATITPTLTQAQLAAYNYIDITASTTATTTSITLPATSTLTTLIPNTGDTKEWLIENQNIAAGAVTILAGTGIELIAVTTNDDVIDGQEYAELKCTRKANTNVVCLVSELLAAD